LSHERLAVLFQMKANPMLKNMTVIAVAATVALTAVATPQQAEARNGRVAAGVIGGLAAGAIIGGIIASNRGYYGPGYYGGYGPAYYGRGYYDGPRYYYGRGYYAEPRTYARRYYGPGPYAYEPDGGYGYGAYGQCWPCY
jgi:hypothetical protein